MSLIPAKKEVKVRDKLMPGRRIFQAKTDALLMTTSGKASRVEETAIRRRRQRLRTLDLSDKPSSKAYSKDPFGRRTWRRSEKSR
jgi:hypothetical protein